MPTAVLSVGQYGHVLLKGAKHWSFLLLKSDGVAVAYQLTGSTKTYEFKKPEEVIIKKTQTYLGKVDVGCIDIAKQNDLYNVLNKVNIKRGDVNWNCQNWIIEGLKALNKEGFEIDVLTHDDLAEKLQLAKRDE